MEIIECIKQENNISAIKIIEQYENEIYIKVSLQDFKRTCLAMHGYLNSPIMGMFAKDNRKENKSFSIYSVFMGVKIHKWFIIEAEIPQDKLEFDSLAKEMYSANLFEREIKEMFGIEPIGNPDLRRLNLHEEVWPQGLYPLRKDFVIKEELQAAGKYEFNKVEGEGIFEIPVGPVHAGIIGPGHFRFSVAGEPIINLEIRLGFTHRGVEKLFEGKFADEAVALAERVSGDSSFAHSWAFCAAVEKISKIKVSEQCLLLRAIFLELERMYNHVNDIGGIAVDVGFTFPASYASVIKENIHNLNDKLTGSRFLKGVNIVGGVTKVINKDLLQSSLKLIKVDFERLVEILQSSISFMDRVDQTGVLRKKTAEDLGVIGLALRACGIAKDLRKDFLLIYSKVKFNIATQESGDALARLNLRIEEFKESINLITQLAGNLNCEQLNSSCSKIGAGFALGYIEAWRGPVLYWVEADMLGKIIRCKVIDPSFHNWQGLSYAVLGDIVPDFPLCNKSFDLSYSGNDL